MTTGNDRTPAPAVGADDDAVIVASGVGKSYVTTIGGPTRNANLNDLIMVLRQVFRRRGSQQAASGRDFQALADVSFSLKRGKVLGLIGANGSGKSTLLKLISGITAPTAGRIVVRGRIVSLIELGLGFEEDRTGRENIRTSAILYDISLDDIDRRIEAISEFAGIGQFMDVPVRTYSSGMYLRLSFATAIHMDPEIIIADEVLAVGDIAFRRKSLDYMLGLRQQGKSIIYVSHDLSEIRMLADEVLWLAGGRIVAQGPTEEILEAYEASMLGGQPGAAPPAAVPTAPVLLPAASGLPPEEPQVTVERMELVGAKQPPSGPARLELALDRNGIELQFVLSRGIDAVYPIVDILAEGEVLATLCGEDWINVLGRRVFVHLPIPANLLTPGHYTARFSIELRLGSDIRRMECRTIEVTAWRAPELAPQPYIHRIRGPGSISPLFVNRDAWTVRQWVLKEDKEDAVR